MLFNSAPFVFFFLIVLTVHRRLAPERRNAWLLVCSAVFYALWIPAYFLLLLAMIVVNFALMQGIARMRGSRLPLVLSIVFTLGVLAYFKYALFFVEATLPLSRALLGVEPPLPSVLLPLGISFYSFQILALQIDVYRGHVEPPRRLDRYALFVGFFPQLIAGPILRGGEFLPQLVRGGRIEPERTRRGLWLLASGIVKKVLIGDYLLSQVVDGVFSAPGIGGAPIHLIAVYSFAFQIYFDFSGYTDMARGMACLLGFELPLNFCEPYLSRNPAEFWRTWHMTLSRWLRDYLYIPLGGNRYGAIRTYRNLLLTMLLGGLWHGAGWNFVVWGGLHGLWLAGHRLWAGRTRRTDPGYRPLDLLRVAACFHVTCLLWIFFRAASWGDAMIVLRTLATGDYGVGWPVLPTLVVMGCGLSHVAERWIRLRLAQIRGTLGSGVLGGAVEGLAFGVIAAMAVAASGVGAEFIYFQF